MTRTPEQVEQDLRSEREHLAAAVDQLRGSVKAKLPLAAGIAGSTAFVLAGGVGATVRYLARRGRKR